MHATGREVIGAGTTMRQFTPGYLKVEQGLNMGVVLLVVH